MRSIHNVQLDGGSTVELRTRTYKSHSRVRVSTPPRARVHPMWTYQAAQRERARLESQFMIASRIEK